MWHSGIKSWNHKIWKKIPMDGRGTMDATYLVSGVYLRSHTKDAESAICQRFSCFSTKVRSESSRDSKNFPFSRMGRRILSIRCAQRFESCTAWLRVIALNLEGHGLQLSIVYWLGKAVYSRFCDEVREQEIVPTREHQRKKYNT